MITAVGGRWQRFGCWLRSTRADPALVGVFIVSFAVARAGQFEERDPYWQARAGLENLAGAPLARPDTWSWSGVPGDWFQNSPLWNDLLGVAWRTVGFAGIFLVAAAVMGGYLLLAWSLARRLGGRGLPALAGVMASVSPVLAMFSPRGTLAVQVLILGSVLLAVRAAPTLAATLPGWAAGAGALTTAAGLSILGNWLHLSFLLVGPALAVLWAVVWLFAPVATARKVLLILCGGFGWALGPVLSPYGLAGGLARSRAVQEACDGLILEWVSPFTANTSPVFRIMAAAAGLAAVVVTGWLLRRWLAGDRTVEFGGLLALAALGVPAAAVGMATIRFLGVAMLTLAPVVAVAATAGVDALRHRLAGRAPSRWREYATGRFWRVVIAGVLVLLLPGTAYLGSRGAVPAEQALIERLPRDCQLFAPGALSASVILTRPDVRVWIDGRADFYGRGQLTLAYAYFGLREHPLVPPGASCTLLDAEASDSRDFAAALRTAPGWRLADVDGRYELWLPAT